MQVTPGCSTDTNIGDVSVFQLGKEESKQEQIEEEAIAAADDDADNTSMDTEAEEDASPASAARKKKTSASQSENYGLAKIRAVLKACKNDPNLKPSLSYITLISLAIQSSPQQKMLLGEIYDWMTKTFPYYAKQDKSWRNSIRHNLSLNECFVKAGRGDSGKGNYWAIHAANLHDFSKGDFRRRHARRRVKHCNEDFEKHQLQQNFGTSGTDSKGAPGNTCQQGWVAMTQTVAPASVLIRMYGAHNVLSRAERLQLQMEQNSLLSNHTNSSSSAMDYQQLSGTLLAGVGVKANDNNNQMPLAAAQHLGQLSDAWVTSNDVTTSAANDVKSTLESQSPTVVASNNIVPIPASGIDTASCAFSAHAVSSCVSAAAYAAADVMATASCATAEPMTTDTPSCMYLSPSNHQDTTVTSMTSPQMTSMTMTSPQMTSMTMTSPQITSMSMTSPQITSMSMTSSQMMSPMTSSQMMSPMTSSQSWTGLGLVPAPTSILDHIFEDRSSDFALYTSIHTL